MNGKVSKTNNKLNEPKNSNIRYFANEEQFDKELEKLNSSSDFSEKHLSNNHEESPIEKIRKYNISAPLVILKTLLFIISTGITAALAAFSVAFMVYYNIYSSIDPIALFDLKPNQYVTYIYENGNMLDTLHGEEIREYATISEIPEYLQKAVLAVEDHRFYQHSGVDLKAIVRAVYVNLQSSGLSEGASTITQQLVKNNILKDDSVTFERKIEEQCAAYKLEQDLESRLGDKFTAKDYILEQYLNTVNLAHGINGVKIAAKRYFDKELSDITLSESAVIAAIIKNPVKYSPFNNPEDNKDRAESILQKMLEYNFISYTEYSEALVDDPYSRINNPEIQETQTSTHSYFVDQVIMDVAKDLMFEKGMSENAAYNLIYSGGLSIYTTFDPEIQNIVDQEYGIDSFFPRDNSQHVYLTFNTDEGIIRKDSIMSDSEAEYYLESERNSLIGSGYIIYEESIQKIVQPQSSFVIMDFKTGHVKAIAGGRGGKQYDLSFNRATQAKRQPGSCFKILAAYAPALDTNAISANTVLMDSPITINGYSPNNYDYRYRGATSLRTAIRDSINVLAVKAQAAVTNSVSYEYLLRFGFTTIVNDEVRDGKIYTDLGPSLCLGGLTDGVTMLELTGAYGAIANNGKYNEPVFYTKVINHEGTIILENNDLPTEILKPSTAYILTDMMRDVVTRGTGTQVGFQNIRMPVSGKTGTTTKDKDLVFAGYTPYYAASVWLGYDTPKTLSYNTNYHLILWRSIMEKVHITKNLPYKEFDIPEGFSSSDLGTKYNNSSNNSNQNRQTQQEEQLTEDENIKKDLENEEKQLPVDGDGNTFQIGNENESSLDGNEINVNININAENSDNTGINNNQSNSIRESIEENSLTSAENNNNIDIEKNEDRIQINEPVNNNSDTGFVPIEQKIINPNMDMPIE